METKTCSKCKKVHEMNNIPNVFAVAHDHIWFNCDAEDCNGTGIIPQELWLKVNFMPSPEVLAARKKAICG